MVSREFTYRAFVVLLILFGSHQVFAGEREDKAARAFSECDWEAEKVLVIYRIEYESSRRGQSEDKTMAALAKRERALSKRLNKREPSTN